MSTARPATTTFCIPILARSSWIFGVGALFAAMSLAAMPPQAGFVSEWYVFQTVFQGFHLGTARRSAGDGARRRGTGAHRGHRLRDLRQGFRHRTAWTLGANGGSRFDRHTRSSSACLAFPVHYARRGHAGLVDGCELPWRPFGTLGAAEMHDGVLLVPLTAKFAFISPTLLVVVMPLLAILPIALDLFREPTLRRAAGPVWYGGFDQDPERASTTALTFSNALRTFYSFIYRPTEEIKVRPAARSTSSIACGSAMMSRRSSDRICLPR